MMIGFVKDEMPLKTTLLKCNPMLISNTLVSCVIGLKERFQSLMTLTITNVVFFIKVTSCYSSFLVSETHKCIRMEQCLIIHCHEFVPLNCDW